MIGSNILELGNVVISALANRDEIRPSDIVDTINMFRCLPAYCSVTDEEADLLARRLETRLNVTMTIGSVLTSREYEPWLDAARSEIDPYFWGRYKMLLLHDMEFSSHVIATIGNVTDRILGLLQNPNVPGPWDRRGMVVGHVQSGKTANYTGLICKAADAGYRLIVVIAGLHNNLRNQTQERIDEGFVGRDSSRLLSRKGDIWVGVGKYDKSRRPVTFTNSLRDFNKQTATSLGLALQDLNEPAVLVIKKNPTTLRNLIDWLKEHSASRDGKSVDIPMLLIDDEADNASINVKYGRDEISRINSLIRELLNLFNRSCYVAYTATPFANIFIDPLTDDDMFGEDLFPRDYIVSLDPPTDYYGAAVVFPGGNNGPVRYIDDYSDILPLQHKITHDITTLPPSLKKAIRAFVIARAIRLDRGHAGKHCSMLVNASRFTRVQGRIRSEIQIYLEDLQSSIRIYSAQPIDKARNNSNIADLYSTWHEEYSQVAPTWNDIQDKLHESVSPIKAVEVNSKSSGALNYRDHAKTGLNVIAVGGLSLSRGLTLEGLTVSYFLRNSIMYDTLMQMARWFGYRPGYKDLCRIWMPEEAEGWYTHIAESIELLRDELRVMEAAGASPKEFGLKVRSHPDSLIVTARNKMGSGKQFVVRIGLANSFIETATLKRDKSARDRNLSAVIKLVDDLSFGGCRLVDKKHEHYGRLLSDVPVDPVIKFLATFENHAGSPLTETDPVRRYIEERSTDELVKWDILFAGTTIVDDMHPVYILNGVPINCQMRTAGTRSNNVTLVVTNKSRVASRGIEKTGLTAEQIKQAEAMFRESRGILPDARDISYPDRAYRYFRHRPLLIIHLINLVSDGEAIFDKPTVAWSMSFPRTYREEQTVEFVVNTVWWSDHYGDDTQDDDWEEANE